MRSVPAIAFDYRVSHTLVASAGAFILLALAAVVICGLSVWVRLALSAATIGYGGWVLRNLLRHRFDHVVWHAAGHWRLRDATTREALTAEFIGVTALGGSVLLRLRTGPKTSTTLMLFPDNCDAETRRRLRVRFSRGVVPPKA